MDALSDVYLGKQAIILRLDVGRRRVRAVVSREALEQCFAAERKPEAWMAAYKANVIAIEAVIRDKVARACREPIVVSMQDF